jgi:hypothetical protein
VPVYTGNKLKHIKHLNDQYTSGGTPNELQPQGAYKLQGRRIEAPGLPALVLPVDAHRWVLADNNFIYGVEQEEPSQELWGSTFAMRQED